jgi:hypothetical protein
MKRSDEHLQEVVITNAETGQTMTATRKTFNSIYRDKGFELVDRENADKAGAGKPKQAFARPSRGTGAAAGQSAKDVAKNIGLESGDESDPMTFDEAAADTAERNKDTAK